MRAAEFLTEGVDDQLIIKIAADTVDDLISQGGKSSLLSVPGTGVNTDALYDKYEALIMRDDPEGVAARGQAYNQYQQAVAERGFRRWLSNIWVRFQRDKQRPGAHGVLQKSTRPGETQILINPVYLESLKDDPEHARDELIKVLSHEIRHAFDYGKHAKTRYSTRHWTPTVPDEPDSTPSEINAYFTEILHGVERDIKNNRMTSQQALKYGQESLQDSNLVDVTFSGWDSSNPVLRRLSNRMAQFVHELFKGSK